MLIKEFRIILPMSVEECKIAQLWRIALMNKNEPFDLNGIEVVKKESYEDEKLGTVEHVQMTCDISSKVPRLLKWLAPAGLLKIGYEGWNAYPYLKMLVTNPDYLKDNFEVSFEMRCEEDFGESCNVHSVVPEQWQKTEVLYVDIANDSVWSGECKDHPKQSGIFDDIANDPFSFADWKGCSDPTQYTPNVPDRGPLSPDWIDELKNGKTSTMPHMCVYILFKINFHWLGVQDIIEKSVVESLKRPILNFYRQIYCSMDQWSRLTMEDVEKMSGNERKTL